jgi:purine-binding chemotaxis protein CheW
MTTSSAEPSADPAEDDRQVLTFKLAGEIYGVDILRVQEIRLWSPVTRIPRTPQHVLGVLNLRGSIVPIVDLRLRFGLERTELTPLTVIIVLSIAAAEGRREFGVVVDAVADVVNLSADAMRAMPNLGGQANGALIEAFATLDERRLILLKVDRIVAVDVESAGQLKGAA